MTISYATAETIRLNKSRYCRYVDTKQWAELEGLLLPDTRLTFYDVAGAVLSDFHSRREFIAATMPFLTGAHTSHRVSNSELTATADGEVAAIWAMEDYLVLPPGRPYGAMHGYGHYHERWVERAGSWFLQKLELRRTILEFT